MKAITSLLMAVSLIILLGPGKGLAAVPAFPSAEGFGKWAKGGRAGTVIEVTNLNDSGPGSLRAAVEASGPRTVVFRTGGTITVLTPLEITNPYITIAGQTAPGGGITVRNDPSNRKNALWLKASDSIVRFIRSRPGPSTEQTDILRAMTVYGEGKIDGTTVGPSSLHNVIIDHCSFSWGVDTCLTLGGAQDSTVQWCIVSEGLNNSVHPEGPHSRGIAIRVNSARVTAHHNLFAHHSYRNPQVGQEVDDIETINNVTYNWETNSMNGLMNVTGFHTDIAVIGCFFKKGKNSNTNFQDLKISYPHPGTWSIYVRGNIGPSRPDDSMPDSATVDTRAQEFIVPTMPFTPSGVVSASAAQAYSDVLAHAGCRVPIQDSVDQRVINDVINGTGRLIDDPSEVGGWPVLDPGTPPADTDHDGMPDSWESAHGLNPNNASDGAGYSANGYTNLENYLNELAGDTVPQTAGVTK